MQAPMIEFYEDEEVHHQDGRLRAHESHQPTVNQYYPIPIQEGAADSSPITHVDSNDYIYNPPPSLPASVVKRRAQQGRAAEASLAVEAQGISREPITQPRSIVPNGFECGDGMHPNQPFGNLNDTDLVNPNNNNNSTKQDHHSPNTNIISNHEPSVDDSPTTEHLTNIHDEASRDGSRGSPKASREESSAHEPLASSAGTKFASPCGRASIVPHQLVIVLRHGERADEHTPEAMLNPSLTERGVAMVGSSLVPQLKAHLKECYPTIDDSYLKSEFLVVSSPFQRCLDTASALLACGIGSDNALKKPATEVNPLAPKASTNNLLSPVVDARLCEVFGPIRIKADVKSYLHSPSGGGEKAIAAVFNQPSSEYFSRWTAAKGAKLAYRKGSEHLPPWGETLFESQYRYQAAMCELSAEAEHTPSCPRNLILVSHGDMLNAVFGGLYPMRTLFSVEYLGFAVLERRLLRNGMGPPRAPKSFTPHDFRMIASEGLMWINDADDEPPSDWNGLERIELKNVEVSPTGSRVVKLTERTESTRGQAITAVADPAPDSKSKERHEDRRRNDIVGAVGSVGEINVRNGQAQGYNTIDGENQSHTAVIHMQSSSSSCDDVYADEYDDVYDERRGLRSDRRSSSIGRSDTFASKILGRMSAASAAVFAAGYGCTAGLHFAAFAVAAANAAKNTEDIDASMGTNATHIARASDSFVSSSQGWAVGVTGSCVILLMLARHLISPVRVVADDCEGAVLTKVFGSDRSRRDGTETTVPSRSTTFHSKGRRSFVWRLLLRLVLLLCVVVGADVAAAYIAGTASTSSTERSLLSKGLNANAGPWVLLGAALASLIFTEGCAAPWSRFRQVSTARMGGSQ